MNIYTSEYLKPHPAGGAMVQTVTDNLVEVSSAVRIEIFNGVISVFAPTTSS